jgi:hypothetical protein
LIEKVDIKSTSYKVRQTPTGGQQDENKNVPPSPSNTGSSKNLTPGSPAPTTPGATGATPAAPKSPSTPSKVAPQTQTMYVITIVTGKEADAGTSSNVFVSFLIF